MHSVFEPASLSLFSESLRNRPQRARAQCNSAQRINRLMIFSAYGLGCALFIGDVLHG
jgi:hypothetical protein